MTRQDFTDMVRSAMRSYPAWRHGQAAWNIASLRFQDAVEPLRGSDVDPFYDDKRVSAFLDALEAAGCLQGENA